MTTTHTDSILSRPVTRRGALAATLGVASFLLAGCGSSRGGSAAQTGGASSFTFGDTTFNSENEEPNVNPHQTYAGWACMRYGVGETLFKYSDSMEIEPWLATSFENVDELTWKVTLRDGVKFSSGRAMDAQAVKDCLDGLVATHDRAKGDLAIADIAVDGQTLTITTGEPKPTLLNYLSDPYGCIIDMQAGVSDDGIVAGTGPYVVESLETDKELDLRRNEDYWGGVPGFDKIKVITISDGDTLTMSLQSGEIDAAYGVPYASYNLFQGDGYTFSSCATSRAFFCEMNFDSPITRDPAVRKAIAMGIDKEGFVNKLLDGNGYVASGAYPDSLPFGGKIEGAKDYDSDGARKVLEDAGWVVGDDGIRAKDGTRLQVRWLTYPSRQEQPLLAESAQATLKDIGIDLQVNSTADHNTIRKDRSAWDVYQSAMVTAPTGDPEYFFTTHFLDSSSNNNGHYHSDEMERLAAQLADEFDTSKRAELAIKMQEVLLADDGAIFCSHLKMSMISKASVTGLTAHPCDFYEVTAGLRPSA